VRGGRSGIKAWRQRVEYRAVPEEESTSVPYLSDVPEEDSTECHSSLKNQRKRVREYNTSGKYEPLEESARVQCLREVPAEESTRVPCLSEVP